MTTVSTFAVATFIAGRSDTASHEDATLAEMVAYVGACTTHIAAAVTTVTIERVIMRGDYSLGGKYYGRGAPVFELTIDSVFPDAFDGNEDVREFCTVRAASRAGLRAKLARIFPNAKIGR